ncbi:MAG: ABC transporter permease [Candidatus Woesearchaeota archaeon]
MIKKKFNQLLGLIRKFYGYLKKDLMLFYKRKKYLYMFLMFPVIIAVIFLFLLSPSTSEIEVGICNLDGSHELTESFSEMDGFNSIFLDEVNCTENLKNAIEENEFSLGLVIPKDFTERLENLKQSAIKIHYDNTDIAFSNFISWSVDQSLRPFKREIIDELNNELKSRISTVRSSINTVSDLTTSYSGIYNRIQEVDEDLKNVEELETSFLVDPIVTHHHQIYDDGRIEFISISFLFPIISLFLILMLSSTSLIYDKKSGFITKVKTSTSPIIYLVAKLLFFYILSIIILLSLLMLFYIFGTSFQISLSQIPEILKLVLSISIINSLIGLLIGQISENEGIAVLISLIISFPLMLLSGLFFPIQTMPSFIQFIVSSLPLHYQINTTKSILLFNQTMSFNWVYYALVLFFIFYYLIRKD